MTVSSRPDNATPARERCVTSYPARRAYHPGVVYPPAIPGVDEMIDLHCHSHQGQQDALAVAKLASQSRMGGLLYKTIGPFSGEYRPARVVAEVREALLRWADAEGIEPIQTWAGYGLAMDNKPPSMEHLRRNLADGCAAVWMPVFNHANTLHLVGGRVEIWDRNARPGEQSDPLPWDVALKCGYYLLDEHGSLKAEWAEYVRAIADAGVPLFTGHCTHPEIYAIVELCEKLGFRRIVIDHPYSPFIDLSVDQMRELGPRGVTFNFTYDELSPLIGIDPARMYAAIRAAGIEYFTLSSDAGEPLFPNSVECMRLISGYMAAFGMSAAEIHTLCCDNPRALLS